MVYSITKFRHYLLGRKFTFHVVGLLRECVVKRGGTTGVLYQRAGEKGERERTGYVRPKIHRDTTLRHRRRDRINICINTMTNKSNNSQWGAGRLQPNRLANRCRCLFVDAQKGLQDGGVVGSTRAFLRAARASPKPAHTKAMELGKEKQREKRPDSVRQHFVLSTRERSLNPPCLPPFIGQEGSRSGINFLPTESTYLGSSMYLILSYIQHRACVREEPVPMLWCTDCACGRFSSRHRATSPSILELAST